MATRSTSIPSSLAASISPLLVPPAPQKRSAQSTFMEVLPRGLAHLLRQFTDVGNMGGLDMEISSCFQNELISISRPPIFPTSVNCRRRCANPRGRTSMKVLCADLFCGAGGTSNGLIEAASELGIEVDLVAINHWPTAIATHTANHPWARHICARVEEIRPCEVVPRGRLHLLVASPECTFHSIARGGRPIEDQKRVPAWGVIQLAQELYIDNIIIENVPEFIRWGPLGANGKPLKSKVGETYQAFLQALRSLGYRVEERVLCCADYGDATTRKRLFIIATRQRAPTWPLPSHSRRKPASLQAAMFPGSNVKPWRPAREIIDWALKGENIFERKKPLAEKTLKRIAAGLKKLNGLDIGPFLVIFYGTNKTRSIERPLPTVTATGGHIGLCEPFLLSQASGGAPRPMNEPVPTICAKGGVQMVQPFLVPFFCEREGQEPRTHAVDEPIPAVTSHGAGGLVVPFLGPIGP